MFVHYFAAQSERFLGNQDPSRKLAPCPLMQMLRFSNKYPPPCWRNPRRAMLMFVNTFFYAKRRQVLAQTQAKPA